MSLPLWCGTVTRALGAILVIAAPVGAALGQSPAVQMPTNQSWTARRPNTSAARLPLARLIRNPDESGAGPMYALADQSGAVQRYVEPVPGIDLEPYVGYAVKVKHDTGRTLLASQLLLPGQEPESILDDPTAEPLQPTSQIDSLFRGLVESPTAPAFAAPVQQVQYVQGPGGPVVIEQGMPPMAQGMPPMAQGMPPMMGPQGMVAYDPANPNMMGGYPPGAGPIYLDGQMPCGPDGCPAPCPQPQMVMQPMVYPQPQVACPPPPQPQRWAIWGEALWLHPTGADLAHAQQQDGIGGAGTVPFGLIGVADPEYDLGFRIGGQMRIGPKDAIFGQYTWFESSTTSSLAAPNIPGGGGAVGSLVHHPGAALTASAGPVDATYDIDFQLADLAYRYYVRCTNTGEISVFAGGRFGKLEQRFMQSGIFGGGLGGAVDTTTNLDFTGGGPIVGINAEHLIGQTRFSVYGKSSVAALAGSFDSSYLMFNDTTDQTLAQSLWSDDRIVPMLDYEFGLMWTGPQNHCRLAIGYMASFWFNAVTTPVWVDAVQADNYVDVDDTLAFDGAVGHVEFRW